MNLDQDKIRDGINLILLSQPFLTLMLLVANLAYTKLCKNTGE